MLLLVFYILCLLMLVVKMFNDYYRRMGGEHMESCQKNDNS